MVQIEYQPDTTAEPELIAKQTFEYNFVELKGTELKMKLEFGDPLAVSFFGDNYDSIKIVVNQQAIQAHFKTQDGQ